ncbi:MAG: protein kinase [Candidatus Sericytochromatia bacterium]|nr:protein kinase [Candidatus Sericytochromatia bacterium]
MAEICTFCSGQIEDGICGDCGKASAGKSLLSTVGDVNLNNGQDSESEPSYTVNTGITNRFTASSRRGITSLLTYPLARTAKGTRRMMQRVTGSSTKRRNALGGGLVSLPPMPSLDPLNLLMKKLEIPAHRKVCPNSPAHCYEKSEVNLPVEQRHPVLVSLNKGFCGNCGTPYDYNPALKAGDIVMEKYEVKGPIAFGGMGWIYLAFDKILSRWVVLKGLLNAKDEESAAAAVAERQYLAAVKHSKIVGIYDFVSHGKEGYIVMEYVGGRTLHSIRKERGPLPVEEAISYIMGILPAFSYLHDQGYVYCDMKPENIMLEGDDVKLVDLGAMRKINDIDGAIYGTMGFMAPELCDGNALANPSEVSDLYTLGRTLAQLIMEFSMRKHEFELPTPVEQPILSEYESLYRFLLRATHPIPDERFQSAQEMQDQLFGVLREIVSVKEKPIFFESLVFTSDNLIDTNDNEGLIKPLARILPTIKINPSDKAASDLIRWSTIGDIEKKIEGFLGLISKHSKSSEVKMRLAESYILNKNISEGLIIINQMEAENIFDWRISWLKGLAFLQNENGLEAIKSFENTYFEMPGELAPKLALAFSHEMAGQLDRATYFYELVSKVEPNLVATCFGLSRCLAKNDLLIESVAALKLVPKTHTMHLPSLTILTRTLLNDTSKLDANLLNLSSEALQEVLIDGTAENYSLGAELLYKTVEILNKIPQGTKVLGYDVNAKSLCLGAETLFRKAARIAKSKDEATYYIDQANSVRPITNF